MAPPRQQPLTLRPGRLTPLAEGPDYRGAPLAAPSAPGSSRFADQPVLSAYASQVLGHPNLVAYFRSGEPAGTILTDSGPNGLHGTYPATGVAYQVAGPLVNDADTAVTFDGSVNGPTVLDNNALDVGDVFSLECWVKRSSTQSAFQGLIAKPTNAYTLQFGTTNLILLSKSGVSDVAVSNVSITDTTTWHHIVATKSGSDRHIYIDGVDVTSLVVNQTFEDSTPDLRIGWSGVASRFPGSMDEVAVYNAVLTPAEVLDHYIAGHGMVGLTAAATASPTLALTAPTQVPLNACSAVASPVLAISAQTRVSLGASSGIASPTLALSAPTQIPLGAMSASTSPTLALTVPTQVSLAASSATATSALSISARTQVPLSASSGVASAALALSALTRVPLDPVSATSSGTLALTAVTTLGLNPAAAVVSTSLALGVAGSQIPLAPASAQCSATLALAAPTSLVLSSAGASSSTLVLAARTDLPLASSTAFASATLVLGIPIQLPLASAAGASSSTLALTAAVFVRGAPLFARRFLTRASGFAGPSIEPEPHLASAKSGRASIG